MNRFFVLRRSLVLRQPEGLQSDGARSENTLRLVDLFAVRDSNGNHRNSLREFWSYAF